MPRHRVAALSPSATFPPRADLHATYRVHGDGSLTPIATDGRGSLTVRCPYPDCGVVLVRQVNSAALADGYFQCLQCHRKSLGASAMASMRRRDAGTLQETQDGRQGPKRAMA
jgi:hypothetical protein